jgi:SAM-dependent methyltransferase
MQGVSNSADSILIPPRELIIQNGIGVNDLDNVEMEFDRIGKGLASELIRDGLLPSHAVLDVGCGLGRVARALVQFLNSGSYMGIDACLSSIEWCTAHYSGRDNFRFFHADVFSTMYNPSSANAPDQYRFPVASESIDFIFSTSLFTHLLLGAVDNYLKEMARVLRPGGKMWNTFMLLDAVSLTVARRFQPDRPNVYMNVEVPGGRIAIKDNPEALSAQYTEVVKQLHELHGLFIDDIRNGPWSGRPDNLKASYEDVVIAHKSAQRGIAHPNRKSASEAIVLLVC